MLAAGSASANAWQLQCMWKTVVHDIDIHHVNDIELCMTWYPTWDVRELNTVSKFVWFLWNFVLLKLMIFLFPGCSVMFGSSLQRLPRELPRLSLPIGKFIGEVWRGNSYLNNHHNSSKYSPGMALRKVLSLLRLEDNFSIWKSGLSDTTRI